MSQPSLSDSAVDALAAVRAMDAAITNAHPQRHAVRNLKRMAEATLTEAFRRAHDLAWQARDLESLVREVREKAAPPQSATGAEEKP